MGEIVQQLFGNKQVDVHYKGGVYVVYLNAITKTTFPVTSEDMKCPAGAFPKTYLSLEEVQGAFPSATLNIVGAPKESDRVVAPLTPEDYKKYGATPTEVASSPIVSQNPADIQEELAQSRTDRFYYTKLETLFRNTVMAWKAQGGERKAGERAQSFCKRDWESDYHAISGKS